MAIIINDYFGLKHDYYFVHFHKFMYIKVTI